MEKSNFALVTGASSGIGKAIAFELGSLGKNLLLTSLPSENLQVVAKKIEEKYHVKTAFFETDLSLSDGPEKLFNWVDHNKFPVDFLVNNAGMAGTAIFENSDQKYIDDRIMVNVRALSFLMHYFIPELKKFPESFILNVSSLSAFYAIPFKSLYSSTKAFVFNFSKAMRTELKDSSISVSVLCPNGVRTNEGTHARIEAHGNKGRMTSISAEKVARIAVRNTLRKNFLIIPGGINWFLLFLGKILPSALEQKILYNEFYREVRVS